jgi:hypothetical protein
MESDSFAGSSTSPHGHTDSGSSESALNGYIKEQEEDTECTATACKRREDLCSARCGEALEPPQAEMGSPACLKPLKMSDCKPWKDAGTPFTSQKSDHGNLPQRDLQSRLCNTEAAPTIAAPQGGELQSVELELSSSNREKGPGDSSKAALATKEHKATCMTPADEVQERALSRRHEQAVLNAVDLSLEGVHVHTHGEKTPSLLFCNEDQANVSITPVGGDHTRLCMGPFDIPAGDRAPQVREMPKMSHVLGTEGYQSSSRYTAHWACLHASNCNCILC